MTGRRRPAGEMSSVSCTFTEDVDWASEPESKIAPWHGIHHGRAELPHFFAALGEIVEVTGFTPLAFTSSDTDVMVVIRFAMTVRSNGNAGAMDLHH